MVTGLSPPGRDSVTGYNSRSPQHLTKTQPWQTSKIVGKRTHKRISSTLGEGRGLIQITETLNTVLPYKTYPVQHTITTAHVLGITHHHKKAGHMYIKKHLRKLKTRCA